MRQYLKSRTLFCFTLGGLFSVAWCSLLMAEEGADDSLFRWRNLGPGSFSGRIVDVEAVESDFRTVVVASASGGVWKSNNAGATWHPIFDTYPSASIGDIALFQPDPRLIWVGTGEANNRNSVGWGDGIYKSEDGGKTFQNQGLRNTFQIARVVTHPHDPDTVYVAAIGNLWGYTGERGLFRTQDGGRSWQKLTKGLPAGNRAGATDLIMDAQNPEVLYVAFYERLRRPYRFDSGGEQGGIFKSSDAGETWNQLTSGLPQGPTGRIGLAISRSNPSVVMALLEHGYHPRPNEPGYEDLSRLGSGIYRSEDGGQTWHFLNRYNERPFYFSQIRIDPADDRRVYVLTRSFWVSTDAGKSLQPAGPHFGRNYDYHAQWIDPSRPERYFVGTDKGLFLTQDQGSQLLFFENLPVGQYYAIGVDMRSPYFIYGGTQDNGTWGGPSFSRDARGIFNGDTWKLHWGDGMHVQVDPTNWRAVFTEAENGSFRVYDAKTHRVESRRPTPDNILNYTEFVSNPQDESRPDRLPRSHFRFNWKSPLVLSTHNPHRLYLAGNHVFRTVDQGRHWTIVSPDLSRNDPVRTDPESGGLTRDVTGAETHGTIATLAESPLDPDLLWVGTDDGNVQLTRDGGGVWVNVRSQISEVPLGLWVSCLDASAHSPAVAFVAFDGHRSDNRESWLFKTEDYGKSWVSLRADLPADHPIHVVRQDRYNPDLLFVGTEFSLHVSLDGGKSWDRFMNNLPTVAVHDLVIHPREQDLIAATHGRGLWIVDDISPLQKMSDTVRTKAGHIFEARTILWEDLSRGGQLGQYYFAGENPLSVEPSTEVLARARVQNAALIRYHLGQNLSAPATLEIRDLEGTLLHSASLSARKGLHQYRWDLSLDPTNPRSPRLGPGQYLLELTAGRQVSRSLLTLSPDRLLLDEVSSF